MEGTKWKAPNHHTVSKERGRKRRRMAEVELRDSTERAFEAYGKPLENVLAFNYLGRVMTAGDNNWPAVAGNLSKARKSWGRLSRILCREGADARVSGNFFKAVVQAVLLFRVETWVLLQVELLPRGTKRKPVIRRLSQQRHHYIT